MLCRFFSPISVRFSRWVNLAMEVTKALRSVSMSKMQLILIAFLKPARHNETTPGSYDENKTN